MFYSNYDKKPTHSGAKVTKDGQKYLPVFKQTMNY
jgi:hypothetical protein